MDKIIYGGDSETLEGKPLSFQFYSEDIPRGENLYFVNERNATKTFLAWCASRRSKCQHVVYVHNLAFDLPEFLWDYHEKLAAGEFDFKVGKWRISGVYGAPTFCKLSDGDHRSIIIVDSMSWFRGSLEHAAELFCPELPKLRRPAELGSKKYTQKDSEFCAYAMRDAEIDYHMGRAIETVHKEYDLTQCVSVADMAARVFRHKYLTYVIPQPSREVIEAALLSYHGGKNNVAVPAGWYDGVTSLDIKSAYPHAMAEFPAFSNAKLYKRFNAKASRSRLVPDYGVYCVSGKVAECNWPVVFSHAFKPLHGAIDRIWMQGFELNEALRSGELKASRIRGHYYDAERDHVAPALRHFVTDFYRKKETQKDEVLRYMEKLILNSVSGKFIQTRKKSATAFVDIDAGEVVQASELIAGGMFHPFIASAITAHTRAKIHQLEHEYKALHTATDGIFTRDKRAAKMKSSALGAVSADATNCTLLLIRNKLYVLYGTKKQSTRKSAVFRGKYIVKEARHGFQGSVAELERMISTGRRRYFVDKPWRLKESRRVKGRVVNQFTRRPFTLKIGEIPLR